MVHWVKRGVLIAALQGVLYAPWFARENYMACVAFSAISSLLKENSLGGGVGKRRALISALNAGKSSHSAENGDLDHSPHHMRMKFVVSDVFRVTIGCEDLFERAWRYVTFPVYV